MPSDIANTPLSDDEYAALDALLAAPEFGGRAMNVAILEGFLTALVLPPIPAIPERWLPWVFDMEEGETGMTDDSLDEANRIVPLVMRQCNRIERLMR